MPTLTSSTGGAESETRIVSPMPCAEQGAERGRGLDRALERRAGLGDAEVQRPVAGLGEQLVGAHHHDRVVVLDRDLEVVEVVLLEQARPPTPRTRRAPRAWPCRTSRGSACRGEPALTPIRIEVPRSLAARAISLTWSSNLRMLPGLTRTAAQPASIAAKTYFGWKWMSAMTGIWECWAIAGERVGVVLAGAGDPHDVAAGRGQLGDLLEGGVDVGGERRRHRLHRDRGLAADADLAHLDLAGRAARGQHRRRGFGHAQADGGHGLRLLVGRSGRRTEKGQDGMWSGTTRSPTISTTPITSRNERDDVRDRQQLGDVDVAGVGAAAQPGERRGVPPRRARRRCGRRRAAAAG